MIHLHHSQPLTNAEKRDRKTKIHENQTERRKKKYQTRVQLAHHDVGVNKDLDERLDLLSFV
jgi:ABC-type uncharacterized transport system ATPase component